MSDDAPRLYAGSPDDNLTSEYCHDEPCGLNEHIERCRQHCDESARSYLYRAIDRAEEDMKAERVIDARQAGTSLRARYGL